MFARERKVGSIPHKWVRCIPQKARGFLGAANIVSRLEGRQLESDDFGCALHNG